ncbi:MAG: Guanylate kinase [Myxococcaceae bacterium]|jgi:guanylate kinase|nr:Guanylate kinase [Myxococcaceae bacterium]
MSEDFLLLILSSPSGAGKTTLTRKLQEKFADLRFSVSHTTRKPRHSEVDGRDYHFVDRPAFDALVAKGAFVEWAEVHGNLYGTSLEEIDKARASSFDGSCGGMIFDIDYQGARQIRAKLPEVVGIFILPPTMSELERRLRGRASETEDVVQRRFAVAKLEIEHYALFDYILVNDNLETAFETLNGIVLAERARRVKKAPMAERLLRSDRAR